MKQKSILWILLFAMLFGMFSCTAPEGSDDTSGGETTQTTESGTEEDTEIKKPEKFMAIAANGKTDYQLVYDADATVEMQNACDALISMIREATGATMEKVSDVTGTTQAYEICVGNVLRMETQSVISQYELLDSDYVIAISGKKILVVATTEMATCTALEYLMSDLLFIDPENKEIGIGEDAFCHYDGDAPLQAEIVDCGDKALTFVLGKGTPAQTLCRIGFTGNHGWRIQSAGENDTFQDIGASQLLSLSLGEDPVLNVEALEAESSVEKMVLRASDGSYAEMTFDPFAISFYTATGKNAATITSISSNAGGSGICGTLQPYEAIYGTGERFNTVNQRGKRIDMYTADIWDKDYANYMAIPLMCSSRGSGIFINRYESMILDLGLADNEKWSASVEGAPMDCYVFTTELMSDAIYGYSALSGFAEMPEEWTYGMLVCRLSPDLSQKYSGVGERKGETVNFEGVYDMIDNMEKYDLQWTGVLAEAWGPYNANKHQDLKELCDYVHSLGKKFLVYIRVGTARDGMAGFKQEYLLSATIPSGSTTVNLPDTKSNVKNPDVGDASAETHVYLDLTNPEAVKWFFNEYWDFLSNDIGVDGAKIDFCETLPENYELNYYDENMPTKGSHHWYPTAFCSMFWDMISAKPDGGMCFSRGGGIGSQRNPYMWAGDQSRQYSRLQYQLRAVLSSGLSGVPFMSFDMAGYKYNAGDTPIPLSEESGIFIRGTQFTAFTVCMQTHGWVSKAYDFAIKGDPFTTDVYRAYTKLHESLTPYITEYSEIACQTGMPVVRHMILHWQDDPRVYDIEDQYMFGDAFLVAPVLNAQTKRDIYLPQGQWMDLNTGKTYDVGEDGMDLTDYSVPITDIPVFYNMNTESQTAESLLTGIIEVFEHTKTLK